MDNKEINVEILCVGTELLLGNIVNSNAQFISEELHNIGINLYFHSVVGDNFSRAVSAIENGFSRCNTIITTGGLGPTKDDMTKEAVAKYFDEPLVLFEKEKEKLISLFKNRNRPLSENNFRQVYFPKSAKIINNNNGTAPGMILEKDGKTLIMLPGPPNEMKPMLLDSVIPFLKTKSNRVFVSKTLNFIGIGESLLETKLSNLIDSQINPTIAPYAKIGYPILRITANSNSKEESQKMIEETSNEIEKIVGDYIFGYDDDTPEYSIVNKLISLNKTISFAESCTGGMLASKIVNINNSSKVFNESFVTYSNESKIKRLGVSKEILENFGDVSEECAKAMACGVRLATNSDIGVSITGIAGDISSDSKPIGLTYIALSTKDNTIVEEFNYAKKRNSNREIATIDALNIIIKHLKGYYNE